MKIQPIGDKVVVKKQEPEQKTSSGILLSQVQQKNYKAVVVSTGNGTINENGILVPLTVKAGDVVLMMTGAGVPMKVDSDEFVVVAEKDILAIIE